jgi:hypothetical protein
MSTTTYRGITQSTGHGRRRALLTAGVLAALVATAGAGAAPATAEGSLLPFDGIRANAVLTSSQLVLTDVAAALEALPNMPESHLAPIEKNLAEGLLAG